MTWLCSCWPGFLRGPDTHSDPDRKGVCLTLAGTLTTRSLSDLGDRSEHGERARTDFHDIEAHSGSMQREIGGERSEGVMGRSPTSAVDQS